MENSKRRSVSCIEEDRISNLPENLIESILERLPIEDAVSTSIISKRWRYRWANLRALVFDENFSKKYAKNGAFGRNGFIRIINKFLVLHKGCILKFHLHIPDMFLDSFEEVDQWIILLSSNGVRELVLTNSNQCYKLHSYVFSCLELTKMELKNCLFKPPLEFKGFPNLEELTLNDIDFGANMCGTEIYLPQLKELSLKNCTNAHNFNIRATKLRDFTAVSCPDVMLLRLLDSPCLDAVRIYFLEKPIQDFVRVEKINLAVMLSNLASVICFSIDGHFLKFLVAEKIPKLLPHAINSLQYLGLIIFQLADLDQLYGALCLLRNSPNLRSLYMCMAMEPQVDVGPASNQLECPNCLDCTLNQLQTVEITDLEGSRPELLFIKLLLAHSPSLQKFTITPSRAYDAHKILDILKNVIQFPRASPKAKMFFLNSNP